MDDFRWGQVGVDEFSCVWMGVGECGLVWWVRIDLGGVDICG